MVPPPLRQHPARPELAPSRGRRDVRGRADLLARPGRRRLPCRRGARPVQGGEPPRPGRRHRAADHPAAQLDGRASPQGRAHVGPARGARGLPPLAADPGQVRRRPDGRRRGLDPDPGVAGPVRPPRRDAPVVQLRLAARRLVGPVLRRGHHGHLRRARAGRRHPHLGAQQPRRGPARDPLRRRRAGPRPGPGGHPHDAGAARLVVPLPGRGARPRAGRRAPRPPAGPVVVPHRRGGPRRLPGADAVGRAGGALRVRPGHRTALDPAAGRVGRPDGRGAGRGPRARPCRSTARRCACAGRSRPPPGTTSRSSRRAATCSRSAAARSPWSLNCGTEPVALPDGDVLLASGPLDGQLPPDTAVWLG